MDKARNLMFLVPVNGRNWKQVFFLFLSIYQDVYTSRIRPLSLVNYMLTSVFRPTGVYICDLSLCLPLELYPLSKARSFDCSW